MNFAFGYACAGIVYAMVMHFLASRLPVPASVEEKYLPVYRSAVFFFSIILGVIWPLSGSFELYIAYRRNRILKTSKKGSL